MPKSRQRKIPVTSHSGPSSQSGTHTESGRSSRPASTQTRAIIRRFHVLLKKRAQLGDSTSGENAAQLAAVEREMEELGGLDAYQRMSIAGQSIQRGGGSENIFITWLRELGVDCQYNRKGKGKAMKGAETQLFHLLEVGALKPDNYRTCASWMKVQPIDLHSQHPSIIEQDFLLLDPIENGERWDAISLSLVVNFVPHTKDRGRMLQLAHTILRPKGLLFLALPLPCVLNSRYFTFDHLQALMAAIGFTQLKERWKQGGRMAYWLFQKDEKVSRFPKDNAFESKRVLREGSDRNNFAILLP